MTLDELLKKYKTLVNIAKCLGFSRNVPFAWKQIGYIPFESQVRIERLTHGEFKAIKDDQRYG